MQKRNHQRTLNYRTNNPHHHHGGLNNAGGILGKRPIWFVGILVFVSVLAFTFRFQEAENDFLLNMKDDNNRNTRSSTNSGLRSNIDGNGAVQRRNDVSERVQNEIKERMELERNPSPDGDEEVEEDADDETETGATQGDDADAGGDDDEAEHESSDLDTIHEEFQRDSEDDEENEEDDDVDDFPSMGNISEDEDADADDNAAVDDDAQDQENDNTTEDKEDKDNEESQTEETENNNAEGESEAESDNDEEKADDTDKSEEENNDNNDIVEPEDKGKDSKTEETSDNDDEEDQKKSSEETKKNADNDAAEKNDKKEDASEEAVEQSRKANAIVDKNGKSKKKDQRDNQESQPEDEENSNNKEEETTSKADEKTGKEEENTKPRKSTDLDHRPVYFLNHTIIPQYHAFSASWLQRTEDFLSMDLNRIGICEDAAFVAFRGSRKKMLRETADWLDFSIEHLSKWWKMLAIFQQQIVFDSAISKFEKYIGNGKEFPMEKDPAFKETIAVIAFQAYKHDKKQDQAFQLTLMSLGATIESLRRAGFGRVVVVGNGEKDEKATQETFRYLKEQIDGKKAKGDVSQIGNMEVGFAEFSTEDAKTKHLEKNIPRATLFGLRNAFYLSEKKEKQRAANETEYMKTWLGEDLKNWQYVYLTEPDSILQSRPSTLATLKEEVDKGTVLVPHRLQPIPHESDVRGSERDWLYIPEKDDFETVMELDAIGEGDACCDEYQNGKGPGEEDFESCGNFWYMCPFGKKRKEDFSRLKPYKLMRLGRGTGIVSLASNEHARRCIPKRNGICRPPWLSQK